jgi:hypothetical protein
MKRGTPRHRKLLRLAEMLGIERTEAAGIVELLWHLCAEQTPRGDVGLLTNREIAVGIYSSRDPDQLVAALVAAGWLDEDGEHRLLVHDWADHVDDATRKRLARQGVSIISRRTSADNGGHCPPKSAPLDETGGHRRTHPPPQPDNGCLPEPEPEPEAYTMRGRNRRTPAADAAPAERPTRGSRLPEAELPDAWAAFARTLGLDPPALFDEFRDYWRGVPGARGRKADWAATWRNRCREVAGRGPRGVGRPSGRAAPPLPDGVAVVEQQLAEDEARWRARTQPEGGGA